MIIEDKITQKSKIFQNFGIIDSLSEILTNSPSYKDQLVLRSYLFDKAAKNKPNISKEMKIDDKKMLKENIFSSFGNLNSPQNHLVFEIASKKDAKRLVVARIVFLNSKVKDNTELNALARSIKMISLMKKQPPKFLFSTIPASYLPKNSFLVQYLASLFTLKDLNVFYFGFEGFKNLSSKEHRKLVGKMEFSKDLGLLGSIQSTKQQRRPVSIRLKDKSSSNLNLSKEKMIFQIMRNISQSSPKNLSFYKRIKEHFESERQFIEAQDIRGYEKLQISRENLRKSICGAKELSKTEKYSLLNKFDIKKSAHDILYLRTLDLGILKKLELSDFTGVKSHLASRNNSLNTTLRLSNRKEKFIKKTGNNNSSNRHHNILDTVTRYNQQSNKSLNFSREAIRKSSYSPKKRLKYGNLEEYIQSAFRTRIRPKKRNIVYAQTPKPKGSLSLKKMEKMNLVVVPKMHLDVKKPIRDKRMPISLTRKNSGNVFSEGFDIRMRRSSDRSRK